MVEAPDVLQIYRIVRKAYNRALVKWRGWPEKSNNWIPLSDLLKKHEHKVSRYVTKLAKELTLGSAWECCLKEMHYPRFWKTLDRDEGTFYIHHINQNTWETKTLQPGRYESKQQVIVAMNKV